MTYAFIALICIALGFVVGQLLPRRLPAGPSERPIPARTILLPYEGSSISRRAFEAAVRLAKAEDAVIMPAMLAMVPLTLPLDAPLPHGCFSSMPLLEAIEQRATRLGVRVDSRVSRGRSPVDALKRLLDAEHFDRIIVTAGASQRAGWSPKDVEWLLDKADAEVMVMRPGPEDDRAISV